MSTTVDEAAHESHRDARRGRLGRRLTVAALVAFLIAGVAGWWGPRTATLRTDAGPIELAVTYPRVSRGGLPAEWRVTVTRTDGAPLGPELVVHNPSSYLATFDQNALEPTPAESWTSDGRTYWSFDVPDGVSSFTIELDARVQPDAMWRRRGRTGARVGDASAVATYTTWVLP